MKRYTIILIVIIIALFSSCSKKPSSSDTLSPESSSISESISQSSPTSDVISQSGSVASSQSTSASSVSSEVTDEGWPTSFVNIKDANGETVLVELKAPVEWTFDGTSSFFLNNKKVMEVTGLEIINDKSDPMKAAYADKYIKNPEGIPEGFGYISSENIKLDSCNAVLHLWKMWPDDSETPWYPHCYLVEKENYLVAVSFYALDENCNNLHKTYDVILNGISTFK